jgi:hypothetical protein
MSTRYRLTYPYKGTIYRSKKINRAVRECYKDYKKLTGQKEGLFIVTDLDNKVEYKYKLNLRKKQEGGFNLNNNNEFNLNNNNEFNLNNNIKNISNPFEKQISKNGFDIYNTLDLKLSENNELTKFDVEEMINNKLDPIKQQLFYIADKIDSKII